MHAPQHLPVMNGTRTSAVIVAHLLSHVHFYALLDDRIRGVESLPDRH